MAINLIPPRSKKGKRLEFSRRELLIGFCVLLALGVRLIFPAKLAGEWFWINVFLFLIFPILAIRYLLKERLNAFGLGKGGYKVGAAYSLFAILIFSSANYLLITKTQLAGSFNIYPPIAANFWLFLWFELFVASAVFISREFFFRGFLLFGLEKILGLWVLPLQAFLYAFLFFKDSWFAFILAFISALFAGWIARSSRSIYYSFAALWLISIITDIMIIKFVLRQAI